MTGAAGSIPSFLYLTFVEHWVHAVVMMGSGDMVEHTVLQSLFSNGRERPSIVIADMK